jgi:hypothetical protein
VIVRRKGIVICAAAVVVVAIPALASGARLQSVTLSDPRGDQEDGNYKRHPERPELDLRKVTVTRRGRDLTVSFETAASTKSQIYTFDFWTLSGNDGGHLRASSSVVAPMRYGPEGA